MSKLEEPFGLPFENEEREPFPAAPVVPPAPQVGRPFGLTFDQAEPINDVADPTSGAPTPATSESVPPASPEPAPSADNATAQPARLPGERERRLARAEADYQAAVMRAAERLARDDGYADLVHDIIRHKRLNTVEGYEQVDRNFLREERDYRISQPYDGNPRQRYMVNGDRATAWMVQGDEASMNETDVKLKDVGFLLERDPHGEPVKAMVNRALGGWTGVGDSAAGLPKFHAGAVIAQEHRILEEMKAVIEGTSRRIPYTGFNGRTFDGAPPHRQTVPFRRDALTHSRVVEFLDASPQEQAKLY